MGKAKSVEPATEPAKVNKMEMVRNAVKELGIEAKPLEIQEHIKDRYGIEIPTQVVSNYKFQIGKSGGKPPGKPGPRPQVNPQPAAAVPVARPTPTAGITLVDVAAVRELVNRLGVEQVQKLAEVVS